MRIAWPFSNEICLTSPMIDPPSRRIGSISIGSVESKTSHATSARRNRAAGAGDANENARRRLSLFRLASTVPPLLPIAVLAAGSETAGTGLGAAAAATAVSFAGGTGAIGTAVSLAGGITAIGTADPFAAGAAVASGSAGAGDGFAAGSAFAAGSDLLSSLACCAIDSDVGGIISLDRRAEGASLAGLSDAVCALAGGAWLATVGGFGGIAGFSGCWKPISTM